jgi:uncharacterized protein YjiS (DUF1127 family)
MTITRIYTNLKTRITTYITDRRTMRELNYLTDRELADIGLSRWMISNVVSGERNV